MSQLSVQTDGVRSYAALHDRVATGLSELSGADAPDVQSSHGPIASAVSTALSAALGTRHGSMQTTANSGTTIAELLRRAAREYEEGDTHEAERLRAAAEALQGAGDTTENPVGGPAGTPAGPGGAGVGAANPAAGPGAAGMAGQMLGQVGQQVGQLAAMVAQPLAGIAQGLAHVPQQIAQAVQGAAATSEDDSAGKVDRHRDADADRDTELADDRPEEQVEPGPGERADAPTPAPSGAGAGETAAAWPALDERAPQRPQPAQTRPPVS